MKTGRLSRSEWDFIERNSDSMTVEAIAKELNRDIGPIIKHLEKIGKGSTQQKTFETQAEYQIKDRPYWKDLASQFNEAELDIFLFHWKSIVAQFRRDILPTEELQIVDVIKVEILMNRALREQQDSLSKINSYEQMITDEKKKKPDSRDNEYIFNLERQIATMRAAKESLSREYKDLLSKKGSLYKDLKATREQRVQKIEGDKQSFVGLVQKLLRDPDFVEAQNEEMEKMRLAVLEERNRLGDYHEYEDGVVDRPLLNSDTVQWDGE
jgi:hypothetical protein